MENGLLVCRHCGMLMAIASAATNAAHIFPALFNCVMIIASRGNLMLLRLSMALIAVALSASAQAASLTLGCSGTLTTTQVPKSGVAGDPEKEDIVDFSVVVDFDKRAVSGFWSDLNGVRELIPITAADANGVTFKGNKAGSIQKSIWGTVDRITGKVDADETWLWQTGTLTQMAWYLRCKPTKPLF